MRSRLAGQVILGALVGWLGACNELTGANQYEETERCTGPMCGVCPTGRTWDPGQEVCIEDSVWCGMQGGQWDGTQQTCLPVGTCPAGQRWFEGNGSCVPLCAQGMPCGASCCGFGLHCVKDMSGNQWCSLCESAELICGSVTGPLGREECCEPGSTCTNPDRGVCSSAYGVAGQSCGAGLTCNGESCCESIEVPGGGFLMGSPVWDSDSFDDEYPEHKVTVSTYELEKYEVTVGRFRAFVNGWNYEPPPSGAGAHPRIAGSGWRNEWDKMLPENRSALEKSLRCQNAATWTLDNDLLPINCVSWYEAFAFCAWDGGRLPTEAEWEYAAAGGEENRKYPWGSDDPDPSFAVYNCAFGGTPGICETSDIAPVGSKSLGAGRWGHEDLAGNMYEWVLDDYNLYDKKAQCHDCASIPGTSPRVHRGGGFWDPYYYLRAAYRNLYDPTVHDGGIGFRCARTP